MSRWADGPAPEKKAVEDLNHWLKEITGVDMTRKGGPVIRIVTDEKLPPEGYRMGIEGDDLLLADFRGEVISGAELETARALKGLACYRHVRAQPVGQSRRFDDSSRAGYFDQRSRRIGGLIHRVKYLKPAAM